MPIATPEQYAEMRQLVEIGAPHHRFLWPLSMAQAAGEPGFGYVMRLRHPRYLELSYLLLNADRDGRPLTGQALDRRPADAARTPGDDDGQAGDGSGHAAPRSVI